MQAGAWPVPALPAAPPLCRECLGPGAAGRARKPLPAAVPSFREATRWRAARRARLPLHLSPGLPGRPWAAQPPALLSRVPRPDRHNGGGVGPTSSRSFRAPCSQNQERSEQSLWVKPPEAFAGDPQVSAHWALAGFLRSAELGKGSHCPEDRTRARGNASARSRVSPHVGACTRQDVRKCGMSPLMAVPGSAGAGTRSGATHTGCPNVSVCRGRLHS